MRPPCSSPSKARCRVLFWLSTGILILLIAPILIQNWKAIDSYYIVGHVVGEEKYLRAAQLGTNDLAGDLSFYPRSPFPLIPGTPTVTVTGTNEHQIAEVRFSDQFVRFPKSRMKTVVVSNPTNAPDSAATKSIASSWPEVPAPGFSASTCLPALTASKVTGANAAFGGATMTTRPQGRPILSCDQSSIRSSLPERRAALRVPRPDHTHISTNQPEAFQGVFDQLTRSRRLQIQDFADIPFPQFLMKFGRE